MTSRKYTVFLALLLVVFLVPVLYVLSSFSESLLRLFQIIFEIRIIIVFILGLAVGYITRPLIEFFIKPSDYKPNQFAMRQTTKRKMPKDSTE